MAFVIYAMILFVWGERKIPIDSIKNGISITDSLMYDLHFKDGDKILAINNHPIVYYEDIMPNLILGETVEVERDGQKQVINLPVNLIGKLVEKKRGGLALFTPRIPAIAFVIPDTSNAARAGLKRYDKIVGVDSLPVTYFDEYKRAIANRRGEYIRLAVERNHQIDTLHALVSKDANLGFFKFEDFESLDSMGFLKIQRKSYGFFESFPAGLGLAVKNLGSYIDQFKKMFSPKTEAYKGVGGFKSMGSIFPSVWDWQSFWMVTAFFSIALAFMNLLPIPALDGGHVLFTLVEMVTGRKPNQKFLEYAQIVGMVLLLALVLYANLNDWFGWGKGR
jgi:regulator of sigma E protease